MYQRFIDGIEKDIPAKTLVDPSNKDFIGKDVLNFMPKANEIFTEIIKKIKKEKIPNNTISQPQKLELEKKYGTLTYKEYTETIEYQNWLKQNNEQ